MRFIFPEIQVDSAIPRRGKLQPDPTFTRRSRVEVHCGTGLLPSCYLPSILDPVSSKTSFLFIGSLNPDSCSTCRKNTDGLISSELQISKMLRREGFVL